MGHAHGLAGEIGPDQPGRRLRVEVANSITHGIGILAALIGGAVLVVMAAAKGDAWRIVSAAVFAAALVTLYAASTAYHAARGKIAKRRLKVFDHSAIYLLIAGTYTPFTLVGLRGGWGWSLFGVIWALAAAGIVFKLFFTGRFPRLSTAIYIGMGWLVLIAAVPLVQRLPRPALVWLAAGGIAYTAGTIFYLNKRLIYAHPVWHGFVLLGSICHALGVGALMV